MLLYQSTSFVTCAGLLGSVSALALKPRADAVGDATHTFSLYAYGTDIPGLSLFYGDGIAYIGAATPSWMNEAVNLSLSSTDTDTTFLATPPSTTNWTTTPMMYMDTSASAFSPIGFTTSNSSFTTTGFGLYGGWAMHLDDAGTVRMDFYATATNVSDVYEVYWNAATASPTRAVPIALRTVAPVVVT